MTAENTPQSPPPIAQPTNPTKPDVPIPTLPTPPPIKQPTPTNIHLRILLHGEVDVDVPSNTDVNEYSKLIAKDVMSKATDFKVTRILISKGLGGPVRTF